jgi:protein SCO1/2
MHGKIKIVLLLGLLYLTSCRAKLEHLHTFGPNGFVLLNQDSAVVRFPQMIKGKIGVVGYIFTNCYDICPMTTHNMQLIQDEVKKNNIPDVEFISISFDTEFDKPSVLKKYAKLLNLDLSNWSLLTSDKYTMEDLMKKSDVIAMISDSTIYDNGTKSYYFVHTDRIKLIDKNGVVRKNYIGSKIRIDEILRDIKKLNEEN